jgi:Rap1a immunity proteins
MSMRRRPYCPIVSDIPSPILKSHADFRATNFCFMPLIMRGVRATLMGAVVCLVLPNSATSMTSGELLRSCAEVVNNGRAKANGEVDIPPSALPCWYYISAVQNMSVLENLDGVRLLGICSPPDTTLMDYVQILVQKARRKKMQIENAAALAVTVLSQRFPCASNAPSK